MNHRTHRPINEGQPRPDPSLPTEDTLAQLMARVRQDDADRRRLLSADPAVVAKSQRLRALLQEIRRRLGLSVTSSEVAKK